MKIAAVTHLREDDFYLSRWVNHYGDLLGRENCYIILDGSDWTSNVDLSGVNVTILERPRLHMDRIRIDRRMMRQQRDLYERLFEDFGYEYVIKGDCDEYVVIDPNSSASIEDCVAEAESVGAVYSTGLDVIHYRGVEDALDRSVPVMDQRKYAVLSQSYCKVNVISKSGYLNGVTVNAGGHRAPGLSVHVSSNFFMLHLGACDYDLYNERSMTRVAVDSADRFKIYVELRAQIFDVFQRAVPLSDFSGVVEAARNEICFKRGRRARGPQKFQLGNLKNGGQRDYLVKLDNRFRGLL